MDGGRGQATCFCGRKFWHESVFYGAVELLESSSRLLGETQENKAKRIAIVQQYGGTWETPGTASAKVEDLLPDWEVDTGGFYGLQYLQIIDKIAGGETKNENRGPGNNTI